MLSFFKSFASKVSPLIPQNWVTPIRLLVDATTGTPYGIQSTRPNTPDGIWGLRDIDAGQLNNPSAAMLADLDATYRLNEEPYPRYYSNGDTLVPLGESNGIVVPPGVVEVFWSPLEITPPQTMTVYGMAYVRDLAP